MSLSELLPPGELDTDAAADYLRQLCALPLASLQAEPSQLSVTSAQLDNDLSALCFRSYPTFLVAHECTTSLISSLTDFEASLNIFIDASVSLNAAAKSFESDIKPVLDTRTRILEAQDHVDTVGQVLDLPRLVGNCVRSGQWIEAMDLSKRAAEVQARMSGHEKGKQAMEGVRKGIDIEIQSLKGRVLDTLSDRSLKLPAAVRSISLLRKMDEEGSPAVEEEQLQLIFLSGRWDCLLFQTEALQATFSFATDSPAGDERSRFLKRWIEIWREVIGDAVNMYQEIFLSLTDPESNKAVKRGKSTLTSFLHHALRHLSATLKTHLKHIYPISALSTLLTQISYCSAAFARFGFEFKSLIEELIYDRLQVIMLDRLRQGTSNFTSELTPKRPTPFETVLFAPEAISKILALPYPVLSPELSHQPISQLTLFPPLARFLNAVAAALNELRLMPCISFFPTLRDALLDAFETTSNALLALVESSLPPPLRNVPAEEDQEEKSERLQREATRRTLCSLTLRFWNVAVLDWCEKALRMGIYGELKCERPARLISLMEKVEVAFGALEEKKEDSSQIVEAAPSDDKTHMISDPTSALNEV